MFGRGLVLAAALCLASLQSLPAQAGPALVFDPENSAVLYAEDPDALWHPASLTKLMTAYIAFEAIKEGKLKLDGKLVCSEKALAQAPSKVGLPLGGEMTVEQGLKALIIKSANDVAVMLAEAVSGNEEAFVKRMNETAWRLGMVRTKFANANGLPDEDQVTTARDLAYLSRAIIKEYPQYAYLFSLESMNVGKIRLRTHNALLRTFEGADGLKTGFICASGYNIVASATRDGRRLVAIVLGGTSGATRNARTAELLDHGFRRYWWKSRFGDKLETLAGQGAVMTVANLRDDVCRARKAPTVKATVAGGGPTKRKPKAKKTEQTSRAQ